MCKLVLVDHDTLIEQSAGKSFQKVGIDPKLIIVTIAMFIVAHVEKLAGYFFLFFTY